jgi:alanyl-tRNA synthetase
MKKYDRQIGILTKGQLDVFRSVQHCVQASKVVIDACIKARDEKTIEHKTAFDFIHSSMIEIEKRKKLEMQMWDKIKEEYNISNEEFRKTHIDEDTGNIYILTDEYFEKSVNGNFDINKFNIMWNS